MAAIGVSQPDILSLSLNMAAFDLQVKSMILNLVKSNVDAVHFDLVHGMSFWLNTRPIPTVAAPNNWATQVPHVETPVALLKELKELGVVVYIGVMPLSEAGCFLRVCNNFHTHLDLTGTLLYVRPGTIALFPATLPHAGCFRTDPMGNPRLHSVLLLVPHGVTIPPNLGSLANHYFGIGPDVSTAVSIVPPEVNVQKVAMVTPVIKELYHLFGF
jgi:hypothetical protein